MGAASARRALDILRSNGHQPYELERYATSNKIWQTKIKRLRLPDLFCLRCGSRFEVRAKSNLEVKMSDSPTVAGRAWDAGLRDDDTILFLRCQWDGDSAEPATHSDGFTVRALRAAVGSSRLGPPKSAGEGAERDRRWPAVVPTDSGEVLDVSLDRISVRFQSGRRHTYVLRRSNGTMLHPYVVAGQHFQGCEEFLAGSPEQKAVLTCPSNSWGATAELASESPLDRFAGTKAVGLLGDRRHVQLLRSLAEQDEDPRVRLEAQGALLRMEEPDASDLLFRYFADPPREDLRMEAVLIAGEIGNRGARDVLHSMLTSQAACDGEELRAAVVWYLGRGCHDAASVVGRLGDPSDLVAAHAAVSLVTALTPEIVRQLIEMLKGAGREVGSAAWVLEHAPGDAVPLLIELAESGHEARHLAVAILGRRTRDEVSPFVDTRPDLRERISSWWSIADERNWLRHGDAEDLVEFVSWQTL